MNTKEGGGVQQKLAEILLNAHVLQIRYTKPKIPVADSGRNERTEAGAAQYREREREERGKADAAMHSAGDSVMAAQRKRKRERERHAQQIRHGDMHANTHATTNNNCFHGEQ